MIKLSVIIPNYNKSKYIGTLLQHLKEQKTDEVEVIVIDDASTDNSWDIINEYSDVFTTIKNETNKYVAYTRNVGLDKAKGKYVTFIDSDDDIKPYFISYILECIQSNRDGYFFDYEVDNIINGETVEKGYNTMVWSKVYKRSVLTKNNIRFDEDYFTQHILCEDMDFNCRFLNITRDIQKSNSEIIIYRWGVTESVSNSVQESSDEEPWFESFIRDNEGIMDEYFK